MNISATNTVVNFTATVDELINEDDWQLKYPLLAQFWCEIAGINITNSADSWLWTSNSSNVFSFRFVWEAVLGRLPTRDRLFRFGITQETSCVRCDQGVVSNAHLFFQCPSSSYIWSLCKLKLGLSATNMGSVCEEALEIKQKFRFKDSLSTLSRLVFAVAV